MVNATAITEYTTNAPETFDPKINNWAEGIVVTIDADTSKIAIRGTERPYASEYAKMLKKIHEKTEAMTQDKRAVKASEIRLEWKEKLEKAHGLEVGADRDMSFQLPGKQTKLVVVDETPFYNQDLKTMAGGSDYSALTDKECKAIRELKDLKVGERIVVGYESGILSNHAYAVIKVNHLSSK